MVSDLQQMPLDLFLAKAIGFYYQRTESIFDRAGDFITASYSQLFCQSLASWIYLRLSEREEPIVLVELGPGQAKLMLEILTFLSRDPAIFSKISEVVLVELSDNLLEMQRQALANFSIKITHLKDFGQFKPEGPFLLIANEFFDALPIKQLVKFKGEYHEVWVDNLEKKIILSPKPLPQKEVIKIMSLTGLDPYSLADGSLYEISPSSINLLDNLADKLKKYGGAAIILDYGYEESPFTSTIRAIKGHQILEDFIDLAGTCDLSAEVNFLVLAQVIITKYPRITKRLLPQIDFLKENFLIDLIQIAEKIAKNDEERVALQEEINLLESMRKFKVLELLS